MNSKVQFTFVYRVFFVFELLYRMEYFLVIHLFTIYIILCFLHCDGVRKSLVERVIPF